VETPSHGASGEKFMYGNSEICISPTKAEQWWALHVIAVYIYNHNWAEGGKGTRIPVKNLARFKAPQKNERYPYGV
jgi:hypothetical protein